MNNSVISIEPLLTPKEVAAILKVTEAALAAQRLQGRGPQARRMGNGRVRYEAAAIRSYIESQEILGGQGAA